MRLLPGVLTIEKFLSKQAEPIGEHPEAKKIIPLFKDWNENSWWFRPWSKKVP